MIPAADLTGNGTPPPPPFPEREMGEWERGGIGETLRGLCGFDIMGVIGFTSTLFSSAISSPVM